MASSTNFVLNVLLARWLVASEYGAYSVCWSILLVLAALHNALILEPMTVVGPAEFHDDMDSYFRANNRLNWILCATLALASLLFALIYKDATVRACLLVMAVCVPGYLFLLTARRKQYVVNRPLRALQLSAIYAVLIFGLVCLCRVSGRLSALTGTAAFGMAWFIMPLTRTKHQAKGTSVKVVAQENWRYGKWLFASAILAVGGSDLQTLLLSLLVDLKAAGALRAMMNFVLPLSQLLTVLSIYALPRLSGRGRVWGVPKLLTKGVWFPLALIALTIVYLAVLLLSAVPLEHLLYAGKMREYLRWMPLLAASAFAAGIGASFSTLLRAIQNSQHAFLGGITSTGVGLVCALLLQRNLGIAGALWSLVAANSASALVIVGTYFWLLRQRHV